LGAAIVAQMNAAGMAVDVSHCGDKTTMDAFRISKQPVLVTHSNCRALNPGHPRCKPDEAIREVGRTGSVFGITGVRMFVKRTEPTTIEHVIDQFDHVKKLIGSEHLGVGSDMDLDGYDDLPAPMQASLRAGYDTSYAFRDKIDIEGLDHPKRMFDLTDALIRRKYSDDEIRGILGGNFTRVPDADLVSANAGPCEGAQRSSGERIGITSRARRTRLLVPDEPPEERVHSAERLKPAAVDLCVVYVVRIDHQLEVDTSLPKLIDQSNGLRERDVSVVVAVPEQHRRLPPLDRRRSGRLVVHLRRCRSNWVREGARRPCLRRPRTSRSSLPEPVPSGSRHMKAPRFRLE
jgi:hypothetical protein